MNHCRPTKVERSDLFSQGDRPGVSPGSSLSPCTAESGLESLRLPNTALKINTASGDDFGETAPVNSAANQIYPLEIKVLHEICGIIDQVLQLDQVLESILAILSRSLSMERATVTLKDAASGMLTICASHGLRSVEKERGIYAPGEGVTGRIFDSAEPAVVPDIGREPLFLNKTGSRDLDKQHIAFIGVPIMLNGEPIGVFSVDRLFDQSVCFTEDVRFLTIVATLISQFVLLNRQVINRELNLREENRLLRAEVSERYNHFFTVGVSDAMRQLNAMISKVAPSPASVLLLGESGTGKTLTARIIHELSDRCRGPFAKVNCAALPGNLIESELFGYEKGAFTGATSDRAGRLESADGGTLFLDEIGDLPLEVQSKLLRFLQERDFERLGSNETRTVDVRIIAATNIDLMQAVNESRFRADLYYRLNVFPIPIPPLRERRADIPLLIDYFLEKTAKQYGHRLRFSPASIDRLLAYHWPGNVRELENMVERISILADKPVIGPEDLPSYIGAAESAVCMQPSLAHANANLADIERQTVIEALQRHGWNQSKAARDIGLTPRQIGYRIKKFQLEELIPKGRRRRRTPSQMYPEKSHS